MHSIFSGVWMCKEFTIAHVDEKCLELMWHLRDCQANFSTKLCLWKQKTSIINSKL